MKHDAVSSWKQLQETAKKERETTERLMSAAKIYARLRGFPIPVYRNDALKLAEIALSECRAIGFQSDHQR